MTHSLPSEYTFSLKRRRTLRVFLLLSVLSLGIGLGAKIFDLVVLGNAWGANPPASFAHLPYGKEFPVDPGDFFQPLSAIILIGIVGALITGWKCSLRIWLALSVASFVLIWILTPTIFWPMINELWETHRGRVPLTPADQVALVHRWFTWDSFRIVLIAVSFFSSLRALSGPLFATAPQTKPN